MSERDYAADMREIIDQYRNKPTYNAAFVAEEIVERLLAGDRELLYGWLQAHAATTISTAIRAIDAASRSQARQNAKASLFAAAAAEAERGNDQPLRHGFLQATYVINGNNERKRLRDMTAEDVRFVATGYEDRANSALMEAAFFRAVAKKIGNRTVGEVFTNAQLTELRGSLPSK